MKNTENIVGVIIGVDRVGEADARVKILHDGGVRTATAVGVLNPAAKLKGAIQLFCVGEFTLIGQKIIGAYVTNTNFEIASDVKRYYLGCAICEVVARVYGSGFRLVCEAFLKLCDKEIGVREIFADFFTRLLRELGYDILPRQDINSAYIQNLDIKIPYTNYFLS